MKKSTKLRLDKETIRNLEGNQLARAAGGSDPPTVLYCPTKGYGCGGGPPTTTRTM